MSDLGRPRRRGIWMAVAALTALVVVMPLGVQVWGRLIRHAGGDHKSYHQAIKTLEIDAPGATVSVNPSATREVRLDSRLSWALSRPRVQPFWDGDTLRINVSCDRSDLFSSMECNVALDLRVPANVAVRAVLGSGTANVRGMTGDLRLEAGSGTLRMTSVRGRISATVGSGMIEGTSLSSAQVDARTGSGLVRLGFYDPPQQVYAEASSGRVEVGLPPGYRFRVDGTTDSGKRDINNSLVDWGSTRRVTVTTSSGSAVVGYPDFQ